MPDFDKDLNPIFRNAEKGKTPNLDNPSNRTPNNYAPLTDGGGGDGNLMRASSDPIFGNGPVVSKMLPTVTAGELYDNRRYKTYDANIVDIEDQKAYAQSNWDKAANGVLKGLNLAGTTIAGSFAMLGGIAVAATTGRLADIWDNQATQDLDEWNNKVDNEYLPNYYTNVEKNARWYSTDNWFKTNFLFDKLVKNSGFAVGAMVTGNIANAGLLRAGAAIGEAVMAGATAAEASEAFRLFTPLLRNTARAFSAGKNIEVANILETELSSIADVTAKSSKIADLAKSRVGFANFGDEARRTIVATYSSAGEASFEALSTGNEYKSNLIQKWKDSHNGEDPIGKDLDKINRDTESVGKASFFGNLALLGITEYVQLPKLLGSNYSASKQAANSLLGKADDVLLKDGKYIAKEATTRFGKVYDRAKGIGKYAFNPMEALQEGLQTTLQVGVQNYYNKAYQTGDADAWTDGFLHGLYGEDESGKGVGVLNSKEGAESILLGGITGGLMSAKGNYQEAKATKSNTKLFLNQLNGAPSFKQAFQERLGAANRNIVLQQQQQDAVIQGDKLEAKDLDADMIYNYLAPRIKYGRFDMVMEDINELKNGGMTEQGLAELKAQGLANVNDTVQSYQERLIQFENTAKDISQLYKSNNLRFSGEILRDEQGEPVLDEKGNTQRKYSAEVIDKMIYAASKVADYDRRIPQLSGNLLAKGIDVQSVIDSELTDTASTALGEQLQVIDNMDDINKDELKQELTDSVELSLRRRQFLNEYSDLKGNPKKYTTFDDGGTKVNGDGKKFRTTPSEQPEKGSPNYSAQSRMPFKGDKRTYDDLVSQYGEGVQNKYDVLQKIMNSPYATTLEKELAAKFLTFTNRDAKIVLGDRSLPNPGISTTDLSSPNASVSHINYEYNADDYEGTTLPLEYVLLHEIGHDLTVYGLSDKSDPFYKELQPLFEFVKDYFKNDPSKYDPKGLLKEGAEHYAFKNIKEFATEALSNRDFQRYLKTIPYKGTQKSAWDSFVSNLKTFFGRLFGITQDSALEEAVAIITNNVDRIYKNEAAENKKIDQQEREAKIAEEKLRKLAEDLEKQQAQIEGNSGDVGTGDNLVDEAALPKEDKKKATDEMFIAGKTESEDWNDPTKSEPHVKRSRVFLNKVKEFANRKNLRAILVTPNNEKALGLDGLTKLSYGKNDMSGATDVNRGFVAQVFVEYVNGKSYFVNEKGEQLGEVGTQIDIDQVIFQTMPTTDITGKDQDKKTYNLFRAGEESQAKLKAAAWLKFREKLFENKGATFTAYPFIVSRGLAIENPKINGKSETNQVAGVLIDAKNEGRILRTNQNLIQISTTGTIEHQGKLLNVPKGRPMLQNGDTFQYINNRTFTKKEAQAIYEVIKRLAKTVQDTGKIDTTYAAFLQNVLFYRGGKSVTGNQISVSTKAMSIMLGDKYYPIIDIENQEAAILEQLSKTYHNVNKKTIDTKLNEKFLEFYINDKGEFTENEWDNYQSYLLSSTYPNGSKRSAENTPLTTSAAAPTTALPYSFKQKYATLQNLELAVQSVPVAPVAAPVAPTAPTVPTIGGFVVDGKTENTFNFEKPAADPIGNIQFTASVDKDGNVVAEAISGDRTKEIAKDAARIQLYVDALTNAGQYEQGMTAEETFLKFLSLNLSARLQETKKNEVAVPVPVTQEPEAPTPTQEAPTGPVNLSGISEPSDDGRRVAKGEKEGMTDAELQLFKKWHAENASNIPYEVLEQLVTMHDGEKAWGVFEDGVAKFVRGGLRGTEYHEIFHAIYQGFLSKEEIAALEDEFKAKSGTFTDRASGRKIEYAKATAKQIEERIADDFSDFRLGKLPARSLGEKIARFFKNIVNFVKSFIGKPSLKDELFKAIDAGKYKNAVLSTSIKSQAPAYRAVEGLSEQETHDFIQDMTARAGVIIFKENDISAIYNTEKFMKGNVFGKIKEMYTGEGRMNALGEKRWEELVSRTKDSLRTLGITFAEGDKAALNDIETNKNDYAADAFSVDWKKSASFAMKFSMATLPATEATNQENEEELTAPKRKLSDSGVNGVTLLGYSRAFGTLIDKLANTTKVSKAIEKLIKLAETDSNYVRMFQRLGGDFTSKKIKKTINFSNFKRDNWRFFIEFMQTTTKQKPDVHVQYVSGNEVFMGSANINKLTDNIKKDWIENIKQLSKVKDSLISFDYIKGVYKVGKLGEISVKTPQEQVDFLNKLGIKFTMDSYNRLKTEGAVNQQKEFGNAVSAIREFLPKVGAIMTFRNKVLNISGQLDTIARLFVATENPIQDSTYRNIEDKQVNAYTENNVPSLFENEFNEAKTIEELRVERPELNDLFSKHSIVLSKGGMFYDKEGNKFRDFKVGAIQGTRIEDTDKATVTSRLTKGDRFTQEINENLTGNYYILIPADSSTEWMMNIGNNIQFKDVESGRAWKKISTIFKGYLFDDVALALDGANRTKLKSISNEKSKELRFFKDILSEKTLSAINEMIANGTSQETIEKYINENIADIDASVKEFIDGIVAETRKILVDNKQIVLNKKEGFSYPRLLDTFAKDVEVNLDKNKMSDADVNNLLTFARVNYVIANIEYHKILFGDPYQFKVGKDGSLDETKRVKSFLSGRRTTFDSPEYNDFLNEDYNKVSAEDDAIVLEPTDPGYHTHKAYVNTLTSSDVNVQGKLLGKTNEADAASWIMDGTYREVLLKNHQWSNDAEAWHQYQMSYMRQTLSKKGGYKYTNPKLEAHDRETLSKKEPKYVLNILKPIATGNKYGKNNFDQVLDKFSQMPVYYSMVEGTNLEALYLKMIKEGFGYAIMESGRKEGAEELHSLYNKNGSFNQDAFNNKVQVPWKAYGIQVETAYEEGKEQTRGSQVTKVGSMDLFDNGVASPEAEEEYTRNTELLDKLHANGYKTLLKRLGVEDLGNAFNIVDRAALAKTLKTEMFRRELSDNIKDSIQLDENGEFIVPFEASPAYIQIKNILYSIVDKSISSPQMSGGGYVQAPVTMWENAKEGRKIAIKTAEGYKEISKAEFENLTEEEKAKVVLTDDTLKFYTKEEPWCEIMLPHWFKDKINKNRFKTDAELIKWLNSSEEGKKILSGIGFRIPTQSLSSAEVFKVKGFLPQAMGKTVIVPSEITSKAGSDFDIDKLNLYLKSIYIDKNGDIRLVNYKGSEESTREFYSRVFDEKLEKKKITKAEMLEAAQILSFDLEDPNNLVDRYSWLLDTFDTDNIDENVNTIMEELEQLGDVNYQAALKEKFVDDMYRRSLENEYYDSLSKLISLPENFERLISPVDDAGLKGLSDKLDELTGNDESLIKNRILNPNYMTSLRHAFVTAKKWVGIAAVNITTHSLFQKSQMHIDTDKISSLTKVDKDMLGDGKILLDHNKITIKGKIYASLSGKLDAAGKYISDKLSGYATAFVDVAKDPYILKIIKSDLAVGTFMFLERVGVPIEQTAMFMNQPIISEYLSLLDSNNMTTLFDSRNFAEVYNKFPTTAPAIKKASFSTANFEKNIKDYSFAKKLNKKNDNVDRNAEQQLILKEFLKYAKMAEFAFKLTQAVNYDTTNFRSGDSLFLKQTRTGIARESNIFSSVDDVLDTTFIGEQARLLDRGMEGMGEVLKLEQAEFTDITNDVLLPYARNQFFSKDKFDKVASKLKASFLDFIIQTNSNIASKINTLLLDGETSVASQLVEAKSKYPQLKILQYLEVASSDRIGGAQSVKLTVNTSLAYDENLYTGMMRELRDFNAKDTNELYQALVNVAVLQGTYKSAISIKNVIPVEDYSKAITPIIKSVVATDDMREFAKQNLFQKNNFKDTDAVPSYTPKFQVTGEPMIVETLDDSYEMYKYVNTNQFPSLPSLNIDSSDRRILKLNGTYQAKYVQFDVITVPRLLTMEDGDRVDFFTGLSVQDSVISARRKAGDLSLQDVIGYQKVKYTDGTPLTDIDTDGNTIHIYRMVNLYGDAQFATEYRTDGRPSVFNNGSLPVDTEMLDNAIIQAFGGELVEPAIQTEVAPVETPEQTSNNIKETTEVTQATETTETTKPEISNTIDESSEDRKINVNQFNITVKPDGKMFYDNGKEVTDQTIKNKVSIRKELQDGTLRTSVYNGSNYFVLLNGKVLGSGKTNLGKESVTDSKILESILSKAVIYKKTC